MKYIVVEMNNSHLCAGNTHECGVVTCSTGGSYPLTLTQSKLLGSKDEAYEIADRLYNEMFNICNEYIRTEDGWRLSHGPFAWHEIHAVKEREDGVLEPVWIYTVTVLSIEE